MLIMMAQLVARLDDDLIREIDGLVAEGVVASRSAAVRLGLAELVERHRRRRVGTEIVEGYRRIPQDAGEVGFSDGSTRRMIAEEAW